MRMTQRRRKSRKPQEDIRKQQAAKDQQEVIALAGADWKKQVAEYLVGCPVSCGYPLPTSKTLGHNLPV